MNVEGSVKIPIQITKKVTEKTELEITTDDKYPGDIKLRINMNGITLARLMSDGSLIIHTSAYPGSPYHYRLEMSTENEATFKLVPSEKKG